MADADLGASATDEESELSASPEPRSPSVKRSKKSALGAAMLGAGAILQPKVDPEEHWSTSPKIVLVVEEEAKASGEPVSVSFDSVPDGPVLRSKARRRRRWFRRPR